MQRVQLVHINNHEGRHPGLSRFYCFEHPRCLPPRGRLQRVYCHPRRRRPTLRRPRGRSGARRRLPPSYRITYDRWARLCMYDISLVFYSSLLYCQVSTGRTRSACHTRAPPESALVFPTGDSFSGTDAMNLILHVLMTLFQC